MAGAEVGGADGRDYWMSKVTRGGCFFVWNLSATRSAELTEAERRTTPNMALH